MNVGQNRPNYFKFLISEEGSFSCKEFSVSGHKKIRIVGTRKSLATFQLILKFLNSKAARIPSRAVEMLVSH